MPQYIPKDATIALTYKCNSRCRMCNIWQDPCPISLPSALLQNLSPHLKYVNLSGGEPFLREDLPEIVQIVKAASPKAQIIISSNGLATELIRKQIRAILKYDPKIGVRISIDGLAETHNKVRGIPNIYEHAMQTVDMLKKEGITNLGISFTIMDFNVNELRAVYELSKKMNIQLAMAMVQNSDIYFQKDDNRISNLEPVTSALRHVIKEELQGWNIKKWLRAYYDYGLLYYAQTKKRLLPTGAGIDSLFIAPTGDIYPSNLINLKMGNLQEGKLDEIWQSENARQVRQEIKDRGITESWIICTIRGVMKKHLFKIGWWIVKNKIRLAV